jgi:hypothetical protein
MRWASLGIAAALLGWLALCYLLRFELMEHGRWVALCEIGQPPFACALRETLGLLIHWRVLAWLALLLAVPAFALPGPSGRGLAWAGLIASAPALVLYTVTPAAFAALLAALRLVRTPRHNATVSSAAAPAKPSA